MNPIPGRLPVHSAALGRGLAVNARHDQRDRQPSSCRLRIRRFAALRLRFLPDKAHNANPIPEHEALRRAIMARDRGGAIALRRAHIADTERCCSAMAI